MEEANHIPADEISNYYPRKNPTSYLRAKTFSCIIMPPHKPANWLRNHVENVHDKSSPGVTLPSNISHRNTLNETKNKSYFPPFHSINKSDCSKDSRKHSNPTIWRNYVNAYLEQEQNCHLNYFKLLPITKKLCKKPAMIISCICHINLPPDFDHLRYRMKV